MAALETGQLHMSWAPFEEVPRIQKDSRLQIIRRPKGVSYIFLEFNTKKPPFDKLALRKAIAYSVDSKEILDASYLYGTVIQAPLPLGVPGFSAEVGRQYGYRRDEAKAAALFKEAGYTKGGDGKLRDAAGKPVKITLTTWVAPADLAGGPGHPGAAPGGGRGVRPRPDGRGRLPGQAARGQARLRPDAHDLPGPEWPDPPGEEPRPVEPLRQPEARSRSSTRPTRRWTPIGGWRVLQEVQKMVLEDAALIPLFSDDFMIAARREVQGFKYDGTGTPMYYDVWLKR